MHQNETRVSIDSQRWPLRIFLLCLVVELVLVALDAFINYGRLIDVSPIRRLFNITREDGLATWFMVIQTFTAGLILWLIAVVRKQRGVSRGSVISWGILSGFFVYMSADDAAEIHERLGSTFKALMRIDESAAAEGFLSQAQSLFPSYDWQLVVLPFFACAGLFMLFFLMREFKDGSSRIILSLAIAIMAVAVVLDFFEGLEQSHAWNLQSWVRSRWSLSQYTVSHFSKSLEEFLEMISISLLLALFVKYLIENLPPKITFLVSDKRQ